MRKSPIFVAGAIALSLTACTKQRDQAADASKEAAGTVSDSADQAGQATKDAGGSIMDSTKSDQQKAQDEAQRQQGTTGQQGAQPAQPSNPNQPGSSGIGQEQYPAQGSDTTRDAGPPPANH